MNDKDPLANFDFDQVSKPGLFLKFQAGKPVTLRVLTVDPVLQEQEFVDKLTGEITFNMKFNFIVYNFTDGKAQIWGATPAMSRKIGELHNDSDFGANIKQMDIKITPTGEKKERRYDIQVLRHSGNETMLSHEQIQEARSIDIDNIIENGSRMSIWEKPKDEDKSEGLAAEATARREKTAASNKADNDSQAVDTYKKEAKKDVVIEAIGDEPVNLDDIPF